MIYTKVEEGSIIKIDKSFYLVDSNKKYGDHSFQVFSGWSIESIQDRVNTGEWFIIGHADEKQPLNDDIIENYDYLEKILEKLNIR